MLINMPTIGLDHLWQFGDRYYHLMIVGNMTKFIYLQAYGENFNRKL